jgi:hypothetical protein
MGEHRVRTPCTLACQPRTSTAAAVAMTAAASAPAAAEVAAKVAVCCIRVHAVWIPILMLSQGVSEADKALGRC